MGMCSCYIFVFKYKLFSVKCIFQLRPLRLNLQGADSTVLQNSLVVLYNTSDFLVPKFWKHESIGETNLTMNILVMKKDKFIQSVTITNLTHSENGQGSTQIQEWTIQHATGKRNSTCQHFFSVTFYTITVWMIRPWFEVEHTCGMNDTHIGISKSFLYGCWQPIDQGHSASLERCYWPCQQLSIELWTVCDKLKMRFITVREIITGIFLS